MRRYVTRPKAAQLWPDDPIDAENYLARTVHENTDPRDTGILDWTGAKIFAVNEMDPVGFVRHEPR